MAALAPDAGRAHVVGLTGAPGRRQVDDDQRARHGPPGRRAPGRRARRRPVVAVLRRCAARRPDPDVGARGATPRSSSARWPRAATSAGCPGRRPRRCACSTPPAATSCSSRRSGSGSPRSRWPAPPTPRWCCSRPGMGDGIQAAKAGILEVADVLVVNKADREGADRTVRDLRHAAPLGAGAEPGGWRVPVVRTVATDGTGVDELMAAVEAHRAWLGVDGLRARRVRRAAARDRGAGPGGAARPGRRAARRRPARVAGRRRGRRPHRPVRRRRPARGRRSPQADPPGSG